MINIVSFRMSGGHYSNFSNNISHIFKSISVDTGRVVFDRRSVFSHLPLVILDSDYRRISSLAIGILRAIMLRRTTFFLWRGAGSEENYRNKALVDAYYSLVARIPGSTSVRVVPPRTLAPLYGPQEVPDTEIWDYVFEPEERERHSSDERDLSRIINAAAGRRILLSIGGQRLAKGTGALASAWLDGEIDRSKFLLVMYGVREDFPVNIADEINLSGGIVVDEAPSDWLWKELIRASHVVWACYLPEYDRSSGIACRSIQLGKYVLVRQKSMFARAVKVALCIEIDSTIDKATLLDLVVPDDSLARVGEAVARDAYLHSQSVLRTVAERMLR